jgi:serine/threonine protein kinase/tetratricopeptide (TPR) repeat protein
MIGETILHYKILEKLGEGGMGVVYKAQDEKLSRIVALKMLPHQKTLTDNERARFLQEARAASSINHPNVCVIYDLQEWNGEEFILMEFVEGRTLGSIIREAPIKIEDAISYTLQACEALQEAHLNGIIHRDIKSENIMVTVKSQVKIMDFGLAKLRGAARLTRSSSMVGTFGYMSPEQMQGEEANEQSDIFSLGVVLYEMIAGKLPFRGEHEAAIAYSIVYEEPQPLDKYRIDVPRDLVSIIYRMLEKDRSARYQTVGELIGDLKAHLSGAELSKITPSVSTAGKKASRRKSKTINSLAVLPITNVSADPETEYLSDGMTETIINTLSKIPKLRVMARSTMMKYKNQVIDPQKVGREVNVRAVFIARILLKADNIMIGAELVDTLDGSRLWGEQYSRKFADILAIHEAIAKEITDNLRLKLTKEQKKRIAKRETENSEAFQLVLKGRYHWWKRPRGKDYFYRNAMFDFRKSKEYFQMAIEKDPTYAAAYSGLCDVYGSMAIGGFIPPREGFSKSESAINKGFELDPATAHIHIHRAAKKLFFEWDWSGVAIEAELAFKKGIIEGNNILSYYYHATGKFEDCLRVRQTLLKLEPLSLFYTGKLGEAYNLAGLWEKAANTFQKALDMDPNFALARFGLAEAFEHMGKYDNSIDEWKKALTFAGNPDIVRTVGETYLHSGFRPAIKAAYSLLLDRINEKAKTEYISPMWFAEIYANLDEYDKTFYWLEKAFEDRSSQLIFINVEHCFAPIRNDERMKIIIQKIKLPV